MSAQLYVMQHVKTIMSYYKKPTRKGYSSIITAKKNVQRVLMVVENVKPDKRLLRDSTWRMNQYPVERDRKKKRKRPSKSPYTLFGDDL
ncbi:hypothetical protein [Stenotrophomonas phage RAS14]